jgi:HemY protein
VTGQLDAFEWRIPMERVAPADQDALPLEIAELDRLERLQQAAEVELDSSDDSAEAPAQLDEPEPQPRREPDTPAEAQQHDDGQPNGGRATNIAAVPEPGSEEPRSSTRNAATPIAPRGETVVFPLRPPDDPGPDSDEMDADRTAPAYGVSAKNTR